MQPRVGEVEVAFREHLLIGGDEDHLGVEVGTDGGMVVKISLCGTRYNQNAVAVAVVVGHAELELGCDGIV